MPMFRKKPVVIEAQELTRENGPELASWCGGVWFSLYARGDQGEDISNVSIRTLEGDMRADLGDWIIKGITGEFYPCKPDIFTAIHEVVVADGVGEQVRSSEAQTWKAWVRIAASPVAGAFIEDVTVYDCSQKPGYHRATITLDDDRAAAGREGVIEECARVADIGASAARECEAEEIDIEARDRHVLRAQVSDKIAEHIRALKKGQS